MLLGIRVLQTYTFGDKSFVSIRFCGCDFLKHTLFGSGNFSGTRFSHENENFTINPGALREKRVPLF